MARQRTWEGEGLRGSPDLLEALATSASLVRSSFDRLLVDFATRRLALAEPKRDRGALFAGFPELPADMRVPIAFEATTASMPAGTVPHDPPINATGSAYAHIAVPTPIDGRLRVFLRGESFSRWSLVALGVDGNGAERVRVEAPIRDREADAYVVLELEGVRDAYVIVTNLGANRPDADIATNDARTFRLLFDVARD